MPIARSPKPERKPAKAKGVKRTKTAPKKAVRKSVRKKPVAAKPEKEKRPRAKVTHEHPGNLVADAHDDAANEAIAARGAADAAQYAKEADRY